MEFLIGILLTKTIGLSRDLQIGTPDVPCCDENRMILDRRSCPTNFPTYLVLLGPDEIAGSTKWVRKLKVGDRACCVVLHVVLCPPDSRTDSNGLLHLVYFVSFCCPCLLCSVRSAYVVNFVPALRVP